MKIATELRMTFLIIDPNLYLSLWKLFFELKTS